MIIQINCQQDYYVNPNIHIKNQNIEKCGNELKNGCSSISNAINSFYRPSKEKQLTQQTQQQQLTLHLINGIYNLNLESEITLIGINLTIKPFNLLNPNIIITGSIISTNNNNNNNNGNFITILENSNLKFININFKKLQNTTIVNCNNQIKNNKIEFINTNIIDSTNTIIITNSNNSNIIFTNLIFKNNNIKHQQHHQIKSIINIIENSNIKFTNLLFENNHFISSNNNNNIPFIYDNLNSTISINNKFILKNNNKDIKFLYCNKQCLVIINNQQSNKHQQINNNNNRLVIESTKSNYLSRVINCNLPQCEIQLISPSSTLPTLANKRNTWNSSYDSGNSGDDYSSFDNTSQERQFWKSMEIFIICIGLIISFSMIVSAIYYINKCYLKFHPDYSEYEIIP